MNDVELVECVVIDVELVECVVNDVELVQLCVERVVTEAEVVVWVETNVLRCLKSAVIDVEIAMCVEE